MSIVVKDLNFVYSPKSPFEKHALVNVNLTVDEGDFLAIIGHTGSGKSTFVQHLNGLVKLQSGTIIVDGIDLSQKKIDYKKLRGTVGMVFQYPEYQLFADTVYDDVAFGPKNLKLSKQEIDERVKEAIKLVGLDFDYVNLGFSGNCRAEDEMADYINSLDFSVFVYDYDHNAPNPEFLEKTHEMFFKKIRAAHPTTPVIMISRPTADFDSDARTRRDIIKKTYENARENRDENVYFVDGELFFKDFYDKNVCFTDTIHPTDLGFFKMAELIEPAIKDALEKQALTKEKK